MPRRYDDSLQQFTWDPSGGDSNPMVGGGLVNLLAQLTADWGFNPGNAEIAANQAAVRGASPGAIMGVMQQGQQTRNLRESLATEMQKAEMARQAKMAELMASQALSGRKLDQDRWAKEGDWNQQLAMEAAKARNQATEGALDRSNRLQIAKIAPETSKYIAQGGWEQQGQDRALKEKLARIGQDFEMTVLRLKEQGMDHRQAEQLATQKAISEGTNATLLQRGREEYASRERISASEQAGALQRTNIQADTSRYGTDVGAATATRGQDIQTLIQMMLQEAENQRQRERLGSQQAIAGMQDTTTRRGQDIGATTTQRGQDVTAATTTRGQDVQKDVAMANKQAAREQFEWGKKQDIGIRKEELARREAADETTDARQRRQQYLKIVSDPASSPNAKAAAALSTDEQHAEYMKSLAAELSKTEDEKVQNLVHLYEIAAKNPSKFQATIQKYRDRVAKGQNPQDPEPGWFSRNSWIFY